MAPPLPFLPGLEYTDNPPERIPGDCFFCTFCAILFLPLGGKSNVTEGAGMYTKDMRRSDWHRILEKDYLARPFAVNGMQGAESLLMIKRVTAPLSVQSGPARVTIADAGYNWLQIAVEGQFVWLTAMYDERDRLIQIYFDITAGNRLGAPDNPCFEDMYLDVVVTAEGGFFVLDQDELDDALQQGHIDQAEYDHAQAVCRRLCEWLQAHCAETVEYCGRAYRRLKAALTAGGPAPGGGALASPPPGPAPSSPDQRG